MAGKKDFENRLATLWQHVGEMAMKIKSFCKNYNSGKQFFTIIFFQNFGFEHLSAGDLLRAERNTPGSQYGEMIETHIQNGTIVPVEVTCGLIEKAMSQSKNNHFLVDGFPRNKDNLDGWNKEMASKVDLKFMLFFECDEKNCIDRCLKRGESGSGRSDDNIESLKKRFETYHNDTMPIINFYQKQDLVRNIDANKSPAQVFEAVKKLFT